ncbi:MAG: SsrA-binding protein [bacterium]
MVEVIAENRRARFDYEVLEKFEAGIELLGFEVKSAKLGRMQIAGSYVVIRSPRRSPPPSPKSLRRPSGRSAGGDEAWLINSQIPPYQPKNTPQDYDPGRTRRLLLRRDEIARMAGLTKQKSVSLIPLRVYLKRGFVKIEVGAGRARKKADKRELLKRRTAEREMRRASSL